MEPLFRAEAVKNLHRRLSGDVILASPLSVRFLTLGAVACVGIALLFASTATYTRRETAAGWVAPSSGLIRVTARQAGLVTQLHVREGDVVGTSAPLAAVRLSTDASSLGDTTLALTKHLKEEGAATEAQLVASRAKLEQQRLEYRDRLALLKRQLDAAQLRVTLLQERQKLAEAAVARNEGLLAKGFMPRSTIDALRNQALLAAQDVSSAQDQVIDLTRQIGDLTHELSLIPTEVEVVQAQMAQSVAAIAQRRITLMSEGSFLVTAPVAGQVVAIPVEQGQAVPGGGAVAVIAPAGAKLIAELYVPSRAAGFIETGQEVRLMYQAFPYQTFGSGHGRVQSISRTVLAPNEVPIPGASVQEPVFRVRVEIDQPGVKAYGKIVPLHPGMLLTADFIVDRRNLLQWLLDPLYAAGRRW